MEEYERRQIESLVGEDGELRQLWEEHLALEETLGKLDALPHRTPEEEFERKRLQKLKLAGKDRIAEILAQHRTE
jgi:uncharacterized protein YdcH (DUF465 family)